MNNKFVNYNGIVKRIEHIPISFNNRAFRFGDSISEIMFIENHKIRFLDEHVSVIHNAMEVLQFSNSHLFTKFFIQNEIEKLCRSSKIFKNARIRFTAYRQGSECIISPEVNEAEFIIEMESIETANYEINKYGVLLGFYDNIKKDINVLSDIDSGNSIMKILASNHCKEKKIYDAVFINHYNRIVETINSNIFIIKDDQIYTPPLSEGCVNSAIRQVLIKDTNLNIKEMEITKDTILSSYEVFISNIEFGIKWVMGCEQKRYYNKSGSKIISILNNKDKLYI